MLGFLTSDRAFRKIPTISISIIWHLWDRSDSSSVGYSGLKNPGQANWDPRAKRQGAKLSLSTPKLRKLENPKSTPPQGSCLISSLAPETWRRPQNTKTPILTYPGCRSSPWYWEFLFRVKWRVVWPDDQILPRCKVISFNVLWKHHWRSNGA